jgi:anthranilate phosphoribosyltransferase
VIGVANPGFAERMLASLQTHGSVASWVVSGPGLDELSTTGPSAVLALRDGEISSFTVDALELGLPRAQPEDLLGGDPSDNARAAHAVLEGHRGPHRDIVLLNSAAGLVVAGVVADLAEGLTVAADAVDSGRAADALARLVQISQEEAAQQA